MEDKLRTDELGRFSNRAPEGGSSGIRVSGGNTSDMGDGSWIVVDFTFSSLAGMGAVVIRIKICLMAFRLDNGL